MLLKKGSKSEDVKKLQSKLGLTADGNFGSGTETKVKGSLRSWLPEAKFSIQIFPRNRSHIRICFSMSIRGAVE